MNSFLFCKLFIPIITFIKNIVEYICFVSLEYTKMSGVNKISEKQNKIRIIFLILFALYSGFFIIGSTFAPLLAHYKYYVLSSKLTSLFIYSCHQQPDRSFWLFGYPVALCCRCYGVYLSTMISSILVIFNKLKLNRRTIVVLILVTVIDIYINYGMGIRIHNTGNVIRFIVGIIMGLLITVGINRILNIKGELNYEN